MGGGWPTFAERCCGKAVMGVSMKAMSECLPMSPKRRLLAGLMGRKADHLPVGNVVSIATLELMKAANAWFPHAHQNPEAMAALAATGHEVLGFDTVMPVFSVTQESAALGCQVEWGRPDMMPAARTHPFAGTDRFAVAEGWMEAPSIRVVLDAIALLRKQLGDHVAIVGKVMGPWSLSYEMMGVEEFLVTTIEDPSKARRCLDSLKHVPIAFAQAQIRAGADVICLADHATGGMVSPDAYRELLLPIHQEVFSCIGCPTVLHCCGNTTDRIADFARSGIDCYHFESQVSAKKAVALAAGRISLMGNVNNPRVLMVGTPQDVRAAAQQAARDGVNILAPECAVPLTTPTDNLRAIAQTAAELV